MNIEEAIKILDYKINMYKEDIFIGDIDKTNIEAIKKVLKEIEKLNNIISNMEEELMTLYLDIMEYNEDYAKKQIRKLKGVDKE